MVNLQQILISCPVAKDNLTIFMKNLLFPLLLLAPLATMAQSGTNSPYSQFGVGTLNDQATGFNKGMNGLAQGFREGNQVNYANPASYSNMDSLTFVFDVGASLHVTNLNEGGTKRNVNNSNFDYAVMSFRAMKGLGVSAGILPYSNVGYNYHTRGESVGPNAPSFVTTYNGSGGIRQFYVGAGWQTPLKGLSVGANISYIWGTISRSVTESFAESSNSTTNRYYNSSVRSYRLDIGLQYELAIDKKNALTFGASFTPGHNFGGSAEMDQIHTDNSTGVADTTRFHIDKALFIPNQISAGVAYAYGKKLKVGADYSLQQWSKKPFPDLVHGDYILADNILKDRHKITLGGEFVNNITSRKYLDRVRIRAGVSYASPYTTINGHDGPKEISASIGFGLPITNAWNNRSMLNISAQWCNTSADGLIKENTFRINLGITFNERWFMKWKLE